MLITGAKENHKCKIPFLSDHIKDTDSYHDFTTVNVDLDNLVEVSPVEFLIVQLLFFPLFVE